MLKGRPRQRFSQPESTANGVRAGLAAASLLLLAIGVGCAGQTRGAELYPEVAEHQNQEIEKVRFVGGEPFNDDTLQTLIDSAPSRCNLLGIPVCIPFLSIDQSSRINVEVIRRDVARISAFYRRAGYFGTRVAPRAEPLDSDSGDVELTFVVRRGDPIILDSITVEGAEEILEPAAIAAFLPSKAGEIFDLGRFDASADQLL